MDALSLSQHYITLQGSTHTSICLHAHTHTLICNESGKSATARGINQQIVPGIAIIQYSTYTSSGRQAAKLEKKLKIKDS